MMNENEEENWQMQEDDIEDDLLQGVQDIGEHLPIVNQPLTVECFGNVKENEINMKFGDRLIRTWMRLNNQLENNGRQAAKYQPCWFVTGRKINDTEHLIKFILKTMNRHLAHEVKLEKLDEGYIIIKHFSTRRQRSQGHISSTLVYSDGQEKQNENRRLTITLRAEEDRRRLTKKSDAKTGATTLKRKT